MIDLDPQQEADAAFANSDSQSFLDKPLNGYSIRRQRAAAALGIKYGNVPVKTVPIPNRNYARKCEVAKLLKKLRGAKKRETGRIIELEAEAEKLKDETPENFVYDGIADDAAIAVFVCSLSDSEVKQVRRMTTTYEEKLEEWMEKNDLGVDGANQAAAVGIWVETLNNLRASRSEPILSSEKGGDDSPNV